MATTLFDILLPITKSVCTQPHQDFFRFVTYYDLDLMILKKLGRFHQENLEAAYPTKNTAGFLP
jgi:hypothetical protein